MTTGIKITFSVEPQDTKVVLTALINAPSGIKPYGTKEFAKHTRFIIRFRNIQQLIKFFNEIGKECTGKYVFMKKPKKGKVFTKNYLQRPKPQKSEPV